MKVLKVDHIGIAVKNMDEALKLYRTRNRVKVAELLEYARVCRVERVIKPYLEATI